MRHWQDCSDLSRPLRCSHNHCRRVFERDAKLDAAIGTKTLLSGQFSQPDGSATKDKAVTKTLKLAGCTVTMVDVSGTFKDSPAGPFGGGKAVDRLDYRMLAAIVETPKNGSYFLKFYGPGKTVAKQADGFRAMIEGMVATGK